MLTTEANQVCENPEVFEGLRLEYNRHLSDQLSLTHICQGHTDAQQQQEGVQPGEYILIAQSVMDLDRVKRLKFTSALADSPGSRTPAKNRLVSVARYGSRGDFLTRFMVNHGAWSGRLMCSGRDKQPNWQLGVDYSGEDFSVGWQLSTNQGASLSYVQQLYSSKLLRSALHLGVQLNYVHAQAASALAFSTRYIKGPNVFTAMVSDSPSPLSMTGLPGVGQFCYARRTSPHSTWATRLMCLRDKQAHLYGFAFLSTIGYEYRFPASGAVKGYLDSSGRCSVTAEHNLTPFMGVSICVDADFANADYKAGVALQVHL